MFYLKKLGKISSLLGEKKILASIIVKGILVFLNICTTYNSF